jgi:hypothetical protein
MAFAVNLTPFQDLEQHIAKCTIDGDCTDPNQVSAEGSEGEKTPEEPSTVQVTADSSQDCKFILGNEVPGLEDMVRQCNDTGGPGNQYCKCVKKNLEKFVGTKKLEQDRERYAKKLEVLSAEYVIEKWLKDYGRSLKTADNAHIFTDGKDSSVGTFCSPDNFIDNVILKEKISDGCDSAQFKVFQAAFAKKAGVKVGDTNAKEGLVKLLQSSVDPTMEAIKGGQVYKCLDESELNLMMYFGSPSASNKKSFNREKKIAEIESRLGNFTQLLEKSESDFIKSPKSMDPTKYQGRERKDANLNDLLVMLPFAKVLLNQYTVEQKLNSAGKLVNLTPAEKKENFQKLKELMKDLAAFTKEIKTANPNEADSFKKGYTLLAQFNLKMKDKIADIKSKSKIGDLTSNRCTELNKELASLACIKPIMSRPSYVERILEQANKHGLPSAQDCEAAKINGGEQLYNCQIAAYAGCGYGHTPSRKGLNDRDKYIKEMFQSKEDLAEEKDFISARDEMTEHLCKEYSEWVNTQSPCAKISDLKARQECMTKGKGSRDAFISAKPSSVLSGLILAKRIVNSQTGGAAGAGNETSSRVSEQIRNKTLRDGYRNLAEALSDSMDGVTVQSSTPVAPPQGRFINAIAEMTENAAKTVSASANNNQSGNQAGFTPFVNSEVIKREVAEKDEEIKDKEEQIARRVAEIQSAPVAEQSALSAQVASLQADLKRLQDERKELERQKQAITEAEAEAEVEANKAAATKKRTRAPASVVENNSDSVRSNGFSTGSTGGATPSAVSNAPASNAGFNTAGSFGGGGLGATRGGTVQGLNSALLAANQSRSLVISGQSVPTTNVVSVEVANASDKASLEKLISAQKDRLQFNSEGWATVEVIDQATKSTIYMKVRLDDSKLVVTQLPNSDQQGIRKQVREWTASYKNFIDRLNKTKREAAGVTE